MDREVLFGKTLEQIKRKGKEQGGILSEQEIEEAFACFSLDQSRLDMIYAYLNKQGIGIGEPADMDEVMDDHDSRYLERYLREITLQEPLSDGEREALILRAMAGEADARQELISVFLPQVADMARLYAGQGAAMEDLVGEGNVALLTGMEMLGALEHPSEVQGMLGRRIMEAMEDLIAEHVRSGDIGKQVRQRVNQVADAAKELSETLLRKVTVQELAGESDITEEEIREALRLCAGKIDGIEDGHNR